MSAPPGDAPGRSERDDEVLLAVLADVLDRDEPFPVERLAAVEAEAFALRAVDAELAELLFDSAVEATPVLRGDGPRALSYVAEGLVLDVELQGDGTLNGRVAPVDVALALEGPSGAAEVRPDHLGRFSAAVPAGRVRFVARPAPQARRILTPWIFH